MGYTICICKKDIIYICIISYLSFPKQFAFAFVKEKSEIHQVYSFPLYIFWFIKFLKEWDMLTDDVLYCSVIRNGTASSTQYIKKMLKLL